MEFAILIPAFLIVFYFLFIVTKETMKENKYYQWIAEQDSLHYEEVENSFNGSYSNE
jgi:hypothetical protein